MEFAHYKCRIIIIIIIIIIKYLQQDSNKLSRLRKNWLPLQNSPHKTNLWLNELVGDEDEIFLAGRH